MKRKLTKDYIVASVFFGALPSFMLAGVLVQCLLPGLAALAIGTAAGSGLALLGLLNI